MRLLEADDRQQRARDELTFEAWGGGLSRAQFLERERRLRSHPWAARALTTLLWVDEAGRVLASCEAFEGPASVGAQAGVVSTLASVFVEPPLRGRGHASALLRAVLRRQAGRGHLATVLFSEVGVGLYQRLGFWPVPAFDTFFEACADAPDVEWLDEALPPPVRAPAPSDTLRLDVTAARLDWHLERERCYREALGRPALRAHGARHSGAVISWTAYWKLGELHVLSLDAAPPGVQAALLAAAARAAHEAGLPVVRCWETAPLDALPGARRAPRTDEIAMYCPHRPGVQAWTQVERALWA